MTPDKAFMIVNTRSGHCLTAGKKNTRTSLVPKNKATNEQEQLWSYNNEKRIVYMNTKDGKK